MAQKFNWKRQGAGYYTATTPAGHEVEIIGYYVSAEEAQGYGAGMRWVVQDQDPAEAQKGGFDPAPTLWEAKLDAEEFWDATVAQNEAYNAQKYYA